MILNNASIEALRAGFRRDFQGALTEVENKRDRVATTIRSSTAQNTYGWLKQMPGMEKWIGPRPIHGIAEAGYVIENEHYVDTVAVNRNDVEDDNLGQYSQLVSAMSEAAATLPEQLVWGLLKDGFTTECWDGQNFFDTDHPITDENGNETVFSNSGGGSGDPWFLLSTNRVIKPLILQERKPITFTYKDRADDDNVFTMNTLLYGVEWRGAVGFSLPQLAYGSMQTLDATAYAAARAAVRNMKGDGGRPLGLTPNLLVVPPSLEAAGLELLNAERDAAGATNVWRGTAELLVVEWLT